MKKTFTQKIVEKIREKTPLKIRHKIGHTLGKFLYLFDKKIKKIYPNPNVLSMIDTIDLILEKKLSVIRFGDGEIFMIDGGNTAFQKKQSDLAERLEEIIKIKKNGLLICIPGIFDGVEKFETIAYWFFMHHLYRHNHVWNNILSSETIYGETNITRPYLAYKNKSQCDIIFKKLFLIWENKDVVLIEGEKSRLGVGNDMFDKTKSMKRILCPPENAYGKYEEIKKEALKIEKGKLILISLGPTAKVLAYDLFLEGYRVIDIGHIDMEYEMFLRKESKLTKVPYKYFNEINERTPEECNDKKYLEQILLSVV